MEKSCFNECTIGKINCWVISETKTILIHRIVHMHEYLYDASFNKI